METKGKKDVVSLRGLLLWCDEGGPHSAEREVIWTTKGILVIVNKTCCHNDQTSVLKSVDGVLDELKASCHKKMQNIYVCTCILFSFFFFSTSDL